MGGISRSKRGRYPTLHTGLIDENESLLLAYIINNFTIIIIIIVVVIVMLLVIQV